MIKVIAFDLVGVLAFEKDIKLTDEEEKLERMFGPNLNDSDYLNNARKIIKKDSIIMKTTENLIDKLYEIHDRDILKKIKNKYPSLKLIIATNHLSYVRNFIGESFNIDYLDDLIISAEVHKIKPNNDFYQYILDKYDIGPEELLFIDDNHENINSANNMKINTIKINKNDDLFEKIINYLSNQNG